MDAQKTITDFQTLLWDLDIGVSDKEITQVVRRLMTDSKILVSLLKKRGEWKEDDE